MEILGLEKTSITLTQSINQTRAATICGHVCGAPTVYMELFDKGKGYLEEREETFLIAVDSSGEDKPAHSHM